MGTWGYKTFENDAASDWLYDLEEAKDPNFLLKPLKEVDRSRQKPDIDACLEALAAAEVIAGGRYEPPKDVPSTAREWIRRVGFSPNDATVQLATRAVGKVGKDSELADSWKEAEKLSAWRKAVKNLSRRLECALQCPPPKRTVRPMIPRQTLAEFIIEAASNPNPEKRRELRARLTKLSNPNREVGGRGLSSMTPLHWVASSGLVEEAKLLVSRGAIVDAKVGCMARPIAFAIDNKHYTMVAYLIGAGADKGYALLNAIQRDEVGIAEQLVAAGADLMDQNKGKVTLLHFAASAGAAKSIKWLLDQGLNVNAKDCTGDTPLHDAVLKPSLAAVKLLVEGGANIHLKNNDGQTALDGARSEFIPRTITRFLYCASAKKANPCQAH